MYVVKYRCSGVIVDEFETLDEAVDCLESLETRDKANDEYEPSTYVIAEA